MLPLAHVFYNCGVPLPILATKLYRPPPRAQFVLRRRLTERLNIGSGGKLTLVSAPAGFGKTTLVSEWCSRQRAPTAWLSLDEGDNDPARFLSYLIAALQTLAVSTGEKIAANLGQGLVPVLQTPQPPIETVLTTLLNEISALSQNFVLVLDDYHVIDSKAVDAALAFLIEHLPPQMHPVIVTRQDPQLPLAQLRARGELNEVRVNDLRFTDSEAARFLNQVNGLHLAPQDIAALESRTEGWIVGLQLAALSMRGEKDSAAFIKAFTGSHRFVMDYLLEQVLLRQSERVQVFLLCTSVLDRLCGPLCDAVLGDASASGQETLEYLEHANLFIVPLDKERHWYRYHHLFADLLRQRLQQRLREQQPLAPIFASAANKAQTRVNELHTRASEWFENNDLDIEAFQHAAAANDIERAEHLIEGKGIPLHLRGAVSVVLNWLESLPRSALDARPLLWWRYASLLLVSGQTTGVEEKLQAAEAALQGSEPDEKTRNLIGRIAAARGTLALTRYDAETMLAQSRRALEFLQPNNLTTRANANWTMGVAYMHQGDRAAASASFTEAIRLNQRSGDVFTTILATMGLGNLQEAENQLVLAAETYQRILQMAGDQPLQVIGEVHLALARILYEWNDLDGAEQHGQKSLELERQYEKVIDRFMLCELFLARLKLARGDVEGATALVAQASQSARAQNFVHRLAELAAAQVQVLLRQGNLEAAAHAAHAYRLPLSQARVHLARGEVSAALEILKQWRQEVETNGWQDERLRALALEAVALYTIGETDTAIQTLSEALAMAEPGGFIRLFVDEELPMARLLSKASAQGIVPEYVTKLLAVFESEKGKRNERSWSSSPQPLIEPLSPRELQILQLIAQGFSNQDIGERLFLALDTVKGHNRRIFDKLQVQRRTEAVARARELGLL